VSLLLIKRIEVVNWQGYYGGPHKFNFEGADGRNSSIVYADNGLGKTALWESIEFVLFSTVTKKNGNSKGLVAKESADKPLMNVDAFAEKDNQYFSVTLFFEHEGTDYRLLRGWYPKAKNVDVTSNVDLKRVLELEDLTDRNNPNRHIYEKKIDKWIDDNLLPRKLRQFFLFDGTRLEEYEKLMNPDSGPGEELKGAIEALIRLPILTSGTDLFDELGHSYATKLGIARANETDDKILRAKLLECKSDIEETQKEIGQDKDTVDQCTEDIQAIDDWLKVHKPTEDIQADLDRLRSDQKTQTREEKRLKNEIDSLLENAWKTILFDKIHECQDQLDVELRTQQDRRERTGILKANLEDVNRHLAGKPCTLCKTQRKPPSAKERKVLTQEKDGLLKQIAKIEEESKYPTAEEITRRQQALRKLVTDSQYLDTLISTENKRERVKKQLKITARDIGKKEDALDDDLDALVREKKVQRDQLIENRGAAKTRHSNGTETLEHLRGVQTSLTSTPIPEGDSLAVRRHTQSQSICAALATVFEHTTTEFRQEVVTYVEAEASHTFMRVSNNSENYSGLKITESFNVDIMDKHDPPRRDAGSQAQSIAMAYSMLDSLAKCSDFDFPMIVDTPGRGMGSKMAEAVWDYFMKTDRQVIFLPYDKELKPDVGDSLYGDYLAATYELEKVKGKNHTQILPRIDNLE
jgi:DNA sulfur modification protein DndD